MRRLVHTRIVFCILQPFPGLPVLYPQLPRLLPGDSGPGLGKMIGFTSTAVKTQVWYPSTKPTRHHGTQALGTGPHSSSGTELTQLFGKVTPAAMSLQVSAGSPVLRSASACLALPPEFSFQPSCLDLARGGSRTGIPPTATNPPAPSET